MPSCPAFRWPRCSLRHFGVDRLTASVAGELHKNDEQVQEIQIEREGADDGFLPATAELSLSK